MRLARPTTPDRWDNWGAAMAVQSLVTCRLARSPSRLTVSLISAEKYSVAISADADFSADCDPLSARHDAGSGGGHCCLEAEGAEEVRLWNGPALALVATIVTLAIVGGALVH
jgi:hypothetical protein